MIEETRQIDNILALQSQSLGEWEPGCFDELVEILTGVDQLTEGVFLELGSRIQGFHGRAHDISQSVGEALQLLQCEDNEHTLSHLQLLIERCGLWLNETNAKSVEICDILINVSGMLVNLELPMTGLRKVFKTLQALRVSTRIEAAKGNGSGAAVLVKSLSELGLQIQQKVTEIFERIESLDPLIEQSLESERDVQSRLIRLAHQEVEAARRILSHFSETRIETGQWTDRLKGRSDEVAQNFGEMIAALQFQDITRQRLDHMRNTLGSLETHLGEYLLNFDSQCDGEALQLLGCICRLQHEQLELSVQEFQGATNNLSVNLQEMAESVVLMANDTSSLSRATTAGSENRFVTVIEVLQSIAGRLETTRATHYDAGDILTEVCSGVQVVAGLVEDVNSIGEEIQLLAMNATISAAHALRRGAGLEIIARNIQIVAEESTEYAKALANECVVISDKALKLQAVDCESHEKSDNLGVLLHDAEKRMTSLDENCHRLVAFAVSVEDGSAALSEEVSNFVRKIDINKAFNLKLVPVFERLNHLSGWANEDLIAGGDANLDKLFRELELCYSMDSQRRVHERFVSRNNVATTSFSDNEWLADQDHGLGDNVDLF